MKNQHYLLTLISLLLLKACFIVGLTLYGNIGLSPDEAQYWTWSKSLDIGYYSKPPGIAWEIFLSTYMLGENVLGIRFLALVIGYLIPIATYFLCIESNLSKKAAFYAALMIAFSPIGFASSFFAITDGPMVCFMIFGMSVIAKGLRENKAPNFLILGAMIACGALFKWPIYLLWIYPLFVKRYWSKHLIFGVLISFLGLLPSLIWNLKHDFGTFKHVFSTIKTPGSVSAISQGNLFEFIGAQAALVSPILFVLLIYSFYYLVKNVKNIPSGVVFSLIFSLSTLLIFTSFAYFKKMQGNWAVFAYPAAFVCTSFVMIERKGWGKKWVKIGTAVSVVLIAMTISVPLLQKQGIGIPYKLNAFRHNMGWEHIETSLANAGYNPETNFLFGDKYQTSSILSFYGKNKKRAYFLNLQGIRKNQFSYWQKMRDTEINNTGYFVVTENSPHLEKNREKLILDYQALLNPYFDHVEYIGIAPIFTVGHQIVKGAFIFKCVKYNGLEPHETNLY
jgi:4-amino-4-deoxy-L-arabinose transferase-like glycosyltransferase